MVNKHGNKVRLHFKTELEELWIGTKGELTHTHTHTNTVQLYKPSHLHTCTERTEKIPVHSIRTVVSESIKGHPDYHIMVHHIYLVLLHKVTLHTLYTTGSSIGPH